MGCNLHYVGTEREVYIDTTMAWKCPGIAIFSSGMGQFYY